MQLVLIDKTSAQYSCSSRSDCPQGTSCVCNYYKQNNVNWLCTVGCPSNVPRPPMQGGECSIYALSHGWPSNFSFYTSYCYDALFNQYFCNNGGGMSQQCQQSCSQHVPCAPGLVRRVIDGRRKCVNPNCENQTNCICPPPSTVTISGSVKCSNGNSIEGATVEAAGKTGKTNSSGIFSIPDVNIGTYHAVRIVESTLPVHTSIQGTSNTSCHSNYPSYEWQIAGRNNFTGCSPEKPEPGHWDLDKDNNFDFVVNCSTPPPPDDYTLTVTKTGTGASLGTVTSYPAGINCGNTCWYDYTSGERVTLYESHPSNLIFRGWGGACDNNGKVTMNGDKTCTADFLLCFCDDSCAGDTCKGKTCRPGSPPGCSLCDPISGTRDCDWKEVEP